MNKYRTIAGDRWDIVALKTTGSESNLDKIMKANLEHREIVVFPAGVELDIPEIETKASNNLPLWKRG